MDIELVTKLRPAPVFEEIWVGCGSITVNRAHDSALYGIVVGHASPVQPEVILF